MDSHVQHGKYMMFVNLLQVRLQYKQFFNHWHATQITVPVYLVFVVFEGVRDGVSILRGRKPPDVVPVPPHRHALRPWVVHQLFILKHNYMERQKTWDTFDIWGCLTSNLTVILLYGQAVRGPEQHSLLDEDTVSRPDEILWLSRICMCCRDFVLSFEQKWTIVTAVFLHFKI